MAQLAVGAVGAAIGAWFGMPQIGFMAGMLVGGLLFPQNPASSATAPKITASTYGAPINVLYGTCRLPGNMIWCDQIYAVKGSGGGKGGLGGGGGSQTLYRVAFATAFCEGPVNDLLRMWADGILIYDKINPDNVQNTFDVSDFTFYNGDESQMPDPNISAWVGTNVPNSPTACPAYRGLSYVVFPALTITNFGNRIPNITAEITNSSVASYSNTSFTTVSSPFSATNGPIAVDWVRNVAYSLVQGASASGIRSFSLLNNQEIQDGSLGALVGNGPISAGQGGSIYLDASQYYKVDPNALVTLANAANSDTNTLESFEQATQLITQQVLTASGSQDVTVAIQPGGSIAVFDSGLNYVYGVTDAETGMSSPGLPVSGPNSSAWGACGPVSASNSVVYIANCDSVSGTSVTLVSATISPTLSGSEAFSVSLATMSVMDRSLFCPGSTQVGSSCNILYDQTDGNIIISAFQGTVKWSPSAGILWQTNLQVNADPQSNLVSGYVVSSNGSSTFSLINTNSGATTSTQTITTGVVPTSQSTFIYDGSTNSIICNNGASGLNRIFLSLSEAVAYPLSGIAYDIAVNRCGLTPEQIDTSLLTGTTAGFAITKVTTGKDVLGQLAQAFFFDVFESDFTLKFVPKGTTSIATVPQADLGSVGKPEDGNFWTKTRSQAIDIPTYVQVNFMDADNDYLPNAAYAKRLNAPVATVYSKQRLIVDLPIAMHLSDATVTAKTWLYTVWTEIDKYGTTLGWQYLYLDPSDTITVNLDTGDSYNVRITDVATGANFTLKVGAVGEDTQTYTQTTTLIDAPSPYAKTVSQASYARLFALNVPLLQTSDDTGGSASRIYYGAGSFTVSWSGGELYTSSDGENFNADDFLATSTIWGTCVNALPNTPTPFSTDNTSTLTVALAFDAEVLSSVSQLSMLNGSNAALVGSEIIQFQNATLNDDGTYTLSTLLRGRRGTEWACGTHRVGDTFILLDTNLHSGTIPLSQIGAVQYDKLVPNGLALDTTPMNSVTYLGYDLKPYAPVAFSRAPSGEDLAVNWIRRSRFDSNLLDGTGTVPLAEETESYDAYILSSAYNPVTWNNAAPTGFIRAFTGLTSPTLTYTAAEMETDGFSPSSSTLYIVAFQNSAAIGHGWPGAASLPAF